MLRTSSLLPGLLLLCTAASAADSTLNMELVFDSSGSMAAKLGAAPKIDSARQMMQQLVGALPEDGKGLNVGFRVFGHAGDNTEAGKGLSCASTELTVPLQGIDKPALLAQTGAYKPTGWTPLTLALTAAAKDFPPAGEGVRNVITVVSDGEETCGGDPCAAAQALAASGAKVVVHVVGFGLEPKAARTLQCIPKLTGGLYMDAQDGEALAGVMLGLVGEEVRASGRSFEIDGSASVRIPKIELPGVRVKAGGIDLGGIDLGGIDLGGVDISATAGMQVFTCDETTEKCDCHSNANCVVNCPDGGCKVRVGSGANATINCPKGGCEVRCGSRANCTVNCPSGQCETRCGTGANCIEASGGD